MSHTLTRTYTDAAGVQLTSTETVTGGMEMNVVSESIANGQTNKQILGFNVDRSQLKSLAIKADVACTIYTNDASTGSPTETITMSAGQLRTWSLVQDGLPACPFSADVTSLYVTNASGSALTLNIRTNSDPTA